MPNYHIIIQQERRTQPERMAQAISSTVQQGDEYVAGPVMLHSHTDKHPVRWVKVMVPNPAVKPEDWDVETEGVWPLEIDQGHYEKNVSDPQFVMVAEWNLSDPYVVVHKGDYSKRNLHFGGWPELTKEQFDALPAAAPAA